MSPKTLQNQPQEASKTLLAPGRRRHPFLEPFSFVFWRGRDPKNHENHMVFTVFWRCSCFSEAALKGTQKRPPKTPQIDPKTTPRRPPEDQKGHSEKVIEFSSKSKPMLDDFRAPNGTPNGTQNRSKNDLGAQGPPKSAQEPPGGPKRPPRRPEFEALRGPQAHEKAVRKYWSKGLSKPLYARKTNDPWLSGRYWGRSPTGDPATEPLASRRGRGAKRI